MVYCRCIKVERYANCGCIGFSEGFIAPAVLCSCKRGKQFSSEEP